MAAKEKKKKINVQWKRIHTFKDKRTTPTNAEFAQNDEAFKLACEASHVAPTKRQASKFRRRTGLAYRTGRKSLKAA